MLGTIADGVMDIVIWKYFKLNSTLLRNKIDAIEPNFTRPGILPRDITFGLSLANLIIIRNRIPLSLIKYIYNALLYSHSDNGKLLIKYLDFNIRFPFEYCSNAFQQIFLILNNPDIPTSVK